MSWRTVVISHRAKLDLCLGQMVVRGEETVKINLSELAVVMVESTAVSLTAALLCELSQRKVKVIFCDTKRNPQAELIPCSGSHDTSAKIRRQASWGQLSKETVWTEIVREKITKQADLLHKLGLPQEQLLRGYLQELELADASNREGHAAKVYFNALFGLGFSRSQENPLNAALNYGYSILLSAFNREIVAQGYITQIGLFHDNMFNSFNLGCDLMEPFRPLVDEVVLELQPEEFGREEKMLLVDILNHEVQMEGRKQVVLNAISIYCQSVFTALDENDLSVLRFYRNEL